MSLVVARGVSKSFGAQDVLQGIDLQIARGEKIALVGPNGVGKSTLLRILAGEEEPTTGRVERARRLRIGYLPQVAPLEGELTPWAYGLEAFAELREMEERLRELERVMEAGGGDDALVGRYGELQERFEQMGGYTYESRLRRTLIGLGLDLESAHRPFDQLSGGQRTRAMLARLLLEDPDLLLLDEPSNHLDIQALEWLEGYLKGWPGALVVVSHDRYFLERVAEQIWALHHGRLESYPGPYSLYVRLREERVVQQEKAYRAQQEEIKRTEEFIRRYRSGQRSKEARGRAKRLARMERVVRPERERALRLDLEEEVRSGDLVLNLEELVVGYDLATPLLRLPDLVVRRGECVAIIGPNGSGKTTLLRTLLGSLPPLAGVVRWGSVRLGYLSQHDDEYLDPKMTVLDALMAIRAMPEGAMRRYLARFLFFEDAVFKRLGDLSGGERRRVALARLVLGRPNVLLLDEPTNHLDLASQEVFQRALERFSGTIFLVSHDRYLIEALATQVWTIETGEVRVYKGGYEDYLQRRIAEGGESSKEEQPERRELGKGTGGSRRKRPRVRLEYLESEISRWEAEVGKLEALLAEASARGDVDRARRLGVEYHTAREALERAWEAWLAAAEDEGE